MRIEISFNCGWVERFQKDSKTIFHCHWLPQQTINPVNN